MQSCSHAVNGVQNLFKKLSPACLPFHHPGKNIVLQSCSHSNRWVPFWQIYTSATRCKCI